MKIIIMIIIDDDSEESNLEYNNNNLYKLAYENILLKFKDKSNKEIIKLYDISDKKNYSEIYGYLLSKLEDKKKQISLSLLIL